MIWGDAHLTDRPVMTWSTRCFLPVAKKVSMKIRFEPLLDKSLANNGHNWARPQYIFRWAKNWVNVISYSNLYMLMKPFQTNFVIIFYPTCESSRTLDYSFFVLVAKKRPEYGKHNDHLPAWYSDMDRQDWSLAFFTSLPQPQRVAVCWWDLSMWVQNSICSSTAVE